MNTWHPRTEILTAAHRWHWIVASFFIGVLLGWLVSLIWPAPYRASLDLYVGLNAYRTTRDLYLAEIAQEEFRNLDDYKNWQMSQLNSLAFSDEFLSETLTRLQAEDSCWQHTDIPTLRAALAIAWRNTGDWHFAAQTADPACAAQTVTMWSQVVTEEVDAAVAAARRMVVIDSCLSAASQAATAAETRQRTLLETQASLLDWQTDLVDRPADQPLTSLEHWNLLSRVATAAAWNWGWDAVLGAAPDLGALPAAYLDWLSQVNALIDAELAPLPQEIAALQARHAGLAADYTQAADQSRALSVNIEVGKIKDQAPQTTHLRPTATLMLVGGFLGVLAWAAGCLVQITRRTER